MKIAMGLLSILGVIALSWILSSQKKKINWRPITVGVVLEILFVMFVLKSKAGQLLLEKISAGVQKVINYSNEGIQFVFGGLFEGTNIKFVFAFNVLTVIIFISALTSALYYMRVIPFFVRIIGTLLGKILGTTKVETFSAVGNSFLGLVEAPLLVKPYLKILTRSEMFAVMVGGTASASGAILVGYSLMGIDMKYLLIAVFSVPLASLIISKIMEPETEESQSNGNVSMMKTNHSNIFEAIAEGTTSGVMLAINVGGMLIAFIAILALIDGALGLIHTDLASIFGYLFYPLALLIGIPASEAMQAAGIIGTKLAANEFVAYMSLTKVKETLSPQTVAILSVALCNFANFSSIGQLIVGLGSLEPSKRSQVAQLGLKSIIGGTLASFLTASIVAMFL
ncbi:NupC/NupG family nucleoside CNT transporter [Peribacillus tepidiphilus]|uniref:NupC/NupG family nucleoside CNT transporter n=1 Tax=Peribacillus tepidiphilus TaxID=2652445 RepID=UPI0012910E10|nr:nucleoside transporter C-terminal domain-containing protein [Peribacillus tepidiphilus]